MFISKGEYEQRLATAFLKASGLSAELTPLMAGTGPDFAVSLAKRTIGLEVTRLFHHDEAQSVEIEGRRSRVALGAFRAWSERVSIPVIVHLHFAPRAAPTKSRVPRLVSELVELVERNVPMPGSVFTWTRDWHAPHDYLEGLVGVSIRQSVRERESHWFVPSSGMVPDLSSSLLQARIAAKNAKLSR